MTIERQQTPALRGYGVLDTPNEPEFDAIVREASASLNAPIALVSLLDEHRQWFKAKVGLSVSETPLSKHLGQPTIRRYWNGPSGWAPRYSA